MDTNERLHHEWLGMAQPEGLVVTASALKTAEANITWPVVELQQQLRELAGEKKHIPDLPSFVREILNWSADIFVLGSDIPPNLRVHLDGGEWLAPTMAVKSADENDKFVLLVEETHRTNLDAPGDDKRWTATAHQRFERLLRETNVPTGLLTNGRDFRLVYAPKGESAGWITFRLSEMLSVDGRPLLGAFHMLLNERRLVALEDKKRLHALLAASREYQNTVSTKLREQILAALRELLRGFERADRLANGAILHDMRGEERQEMYSGLVTVLMRMVFVLYAEERGLLPMESDLYVSGYSLSRLHGLLQDDHQRFGDTIDDRYGAWGRVITLFRLLHDGVSTADGLFLPRREGSFFDPDEFPFLEGRPRGSKRQKREAGEILDLPRISDGVVYRMLDRLLVLDGERLQYKGLDVEQIGSVYEGLMGFEIQVAEGDSVCLMPEHVVVNLEALLKKPGPERLKELKALANLDVKDKSAGEIKDAKTVEALFGALGKRISTRQPGLLAQGGLYLQPGEERRRTGSHYTPRSLTLPIVETTLRPVLERLGPDVRPEQLLSLKVCDPAMGSGAFLVEACRQLADKLVDAWRRTKTMPDLPRDEDPVLHARRLIAQQCIYGVDKNPLAVDLARLSIWLVTFAKEHPFTFVDHSLRHGDSLVGLSKEQIFNLSLDPAKGAKLAPQARNQLANAVREAEVLRGQIHALGDPPMTDALRDLWDRANDALTAVRTLGDLVIAAFFQESSDKGRKKALEEVWTKGVAWLNNGSYAAELRGMVEDLRKGEKPVPAFHWEIEFPEVFSRENPGFDCFVGNPPFLSGSRLSTTFGENYLGYICSTFSESGNRMDLCAYFFRLAFNLCTFGGTLGLVATNTISQGDTRIGGLGFIVRHGGRIYSATRRITWPGNAAVVASIVQVIKNMVWTPCILDGRVVTTVTPFLFDRGASIEPEILTANADISYKGVEIAGQGFLFADEPDTTPLNEMQHILRSSPRAADVIRMYLGGEDLNGDPRQHSQRYVINFGQLPRDEVERQWPELLTIVEKKVSPRRKNDKRASRAERWWQFGECQPSLQRAIAKLTRVVGIARVSRTFAFTFIPTKATTINEMIVVIAKDSDSTFAVLQSGIHESWARFFGSSMKDDLRYTPSDCFETFPFPPDWENNKNLETIGKEYYEFRAALMIRNNEGLTKTYNRFHDPDEPSPEILKLRELHAQMDRAVLDAYGWTDIVPQYDFRPQLDESIRYTWGEETRDEVLARLLELNRVMAAKEAEEAEAAKTNAALEKAEAPKAPKAPKKAAAGKKKGKTKDEGALSLFPVEGKEE